MAYEKIHSNTHHCRVCPDATAIKAIPTLHGKEAKEFLRHAEEAERNFKGFKNIEEHPFCVMARSILEKAGMR